MSGRIWITGLVLMLAALPAGAQEHEGHGEHHPNMEHAEPPTEGLRAELISDIDALESKYLGLADVLSGHFDWRPAEGVRSVGEVFGHVAGANFAIPGMADVPLPPSMQRGSMQEVMQAMGELERSGDRDRIIEALEHSFMHLRHGIADISDAEMEERTTMFGQNVTKRQVLLLVVNHMHEHLGQAIAYARTNGVAPPWSE